MNEHEDPLAWQEREYDEADREREEEDQARHEPLPRYFAEIFNERGAMVKRLACDTIASGITTAKAEANIHSGYGLVRGRSPVPDSPGPLIFDTRDTAPVTAAPAGDLFAGQKEAPR